jgi:hypothetical protein
VYIIEAKDDGWNNNDGWNNDDWNDDDNEGWDDFDVDTTATKTSHIDLKQQKKQRGGKDD